MVPRSPENATFIDRLFEARFGDQGDKKKNTVANLASKIVQKWSPKWSRGDAGRPLRDMRRHDRIACPPPLGAPFGLVVYRPTQKLKLSQQSTLTAKFGNYLHNVARCLQSGFNMEMLAGRALT